MKKQHTGRPLTVFILMVLFAGFGMYGLAVEADAPDEAIRAAQEGLSVFMNRQALPEDVPMTVTGNDSVLQLKQGFQMHTVPPRRLLQCKELHREVVPTGLWRFVVVKEGQPVSLLTTAMVDGKWTAVSMGGAVLAKEIGKVMERWPAEKGYTYRFLRIFQAKSDFVEISKNGKPVGMVPMTAARVALGIRGEFDPGAIMPAAEMMKDLRESVSSGLTR